MVKTNLNNYPSPTWSNYSNQRRKSKNRPFNNYNPPSNAIRATNGHIPRHMPYHASHRHNYCNAPRQTNNPIRDNSANNPAKTTANTIAINPFNNPPPHCLESDVRWVWRKQLEQKRRHIRNTKYYSHYVGNKKITYNVANDKTSATDKTSSTVTAASYIPNYSNTHHLKHLVKIGCPMHDLSPILTHSGYNVSPEICTSKSHLCAPYKTNNRVLLGSVSMKNVGLTFKRNAFSTLPLHIRYICDEQKYNHNNSHNGSGHRMFETDIYVKRIANTNFNKAFRPGSYGKLRSLKKGSWKEGKIFYVFSNDEIIMNITANVYIVFDMKAKASNGIIDGFENIVGGVGLYRPPQSTKIVSCLVFRKDPNFPMECLESSMLKIYAKNANMNGNQKLIIGDKTFDLNNGNGNSNNYYYEDEVTHNMSPFCGSNSSHSNETPSYHGVEQSQNNYNNMNNMNNNYNNCNENMNNNMNNSTCNDAVCMASMPPAIPQMTSNNSFNSNNSYRSHYSSDTTNTNTNMNMNANANANEPCINCANVNNSNHMNNNVNNNMTSHGNILEDIEMKRNEFEDKYNALQYQHNLLIAKNCKLQTLNKQLMESNSNLRMEKDAQSKTHSQQTQQLQNYLEQQHQQISKLNEQIKNNNMSAQPSMDEYSTFHPSNNYNYNNAYHNNNDLPIESDYVQNFDDNYTLQDFQSV